jgi:hypothetical protein
VVRLKPVADPLFVTLTTPQFVLICKVAIGAERSLSVLEAGALFGPCGIELGPTLGRG